jgi:hypothetical protein
VDKLRQSSERDQAARAAKLSLERRNQLTDEVFQNFQRILSNPESPAALLQQTYQTVLFSYDSTDDPQRAELIAIAQAAGIMPPAPVANFRSGAPAGYQPMVGIKSYELGIRLTHQTTIAGAKLKWKPQYPGAG